MRLHLTWFLATNGKWPGSLSLQPFSKLILITVRVSRTCQDERKTKGLGPGFCHLKIQFKVTDWTWNVRAFLCLFWGQAGAFWQPNPKTKTKSQNPFHFPVTHSVSIGSSAPPPHYTAKHLLKVPGARSPKMQTGNSWTLLFFKKWTLLLRNWWPPQFLSSTPSKRIQPPRFFMYFQGYIESFEPIYEPLPMSPRLRITINMMEN